MGKQSLKEILQKDRLFYRTAQKAYSMLAPRTEFAMLPENSLLGRLLEQIYNNPNYRGVMVFYPEGVA